MEPLRPRYGFGRGSRASIVFVIRAEHTRDDVIVLLVEDLLEQFDRKGLVRIGHLRHKLTLLLLFVWHLLVPPPANRELV